MPNTPGGLPTRVSEDLKLAALCLSCSLCFVLVFLYVVCFAFNLLSWFLFLHCSCFVFVLFFLLVFCLDVFLLLFLLFCSYCFCFVLVLTCSFLFCSFCSCLSGARWPRSSAARAWGGGSNGVRRDGDCCVLLQAARRRQTSRREGALCWCAVCSAKRFVFMVTCDEWMNEWINQCCTRHSVCCVLYAWYGMLCVVRCLRHAVCCARCAV